MRALPLRVARPGLPAPPTAMQNPSLLPPLVLQPVHPVPEPPSVPLSLIGQAIYRLIADHPHGDTTRTGKTQEPAVSMGEAHARLVNHVGKMWASTTVKDRRNIWRRLVAWTSQWGLPLNADTACLFVAATGVRPSGLLTYSKALSASFGAMGLPNQPLRTMSTALRGAGASVPESQALPVDKERLLGWAFLQAPAIQLAVLVAWKSASRWAEVAALSSDQFILVTPREVVVDWFQTPKGRRRNPFRASRYVVILGPLTDKISTLYGSLAPFCPLSNLTTTALDSLWAKTPEMAGYTGHSIKRGATTHVLERVVEGERVPMYLLDRLAKHEEKSGTALSEVTIRYGGNPIAMARALETGRVTMLL
eukprot:gene307-biopygen317